MTHDRFGALRAALHPDARDALAFEGALDLCARWVDADPDGYARVARDYARENLSRWDLSARACPEWLAVEAARDAPAGRALANLCDPGSLAPPGDTPRLSAWSARLLARVPDALLRPTLAAIAQDLTPDWDTLLHATGRFSHVPVHDSIGHLARQDAAHLTHLLRALSDAIPPVSAAEGSDVAAALLELVVLALDLVRDPFDRASALEEHDAPGELSREQLLAHRALQAFEGALTARAALGTPTPPWFAAPSTRRGLALVHTLCLDAEATPAPEFLARHVRGPAPKSTQQTLF